ncbi:MAG: prolyl oligopeptidase family serine peptidase [Bdellovibrionaceae bacterium]|nr:prolyl oligopeptidase family serine peptidase [Pseudobdellovibrionaceae bacterium]NUM58111.1 S9 family peptidase [Pseudobdellovibrionaceae bacterium]
MKTIRLFFFLFLISCSQKNLKNNDGYKSFGIDSVSKETLKRFTPPELNSELKGKISLITDIQSLGAGAFNPKNKNEFFFNWGISGNRQVWKMSGSKSFPVQLTGGKDATMLADITSDGKYLLLERDVDGQENPGIYRQPTIGGPLEKLYHKPKVKASVQFVSDDSKFLFFTSNEESADSFYVYKMNLETKEIEKIFAEKGYWIINDHEDDRILLANIKGNSAYEIFEFNLATKEKKAVIGQGKDNFYNVNFLKEKDSYLVLTAELGDAKALYTLKNNKLTIIANENNFDIESFSVNKERTLLSYELNKDGFTITKLFNVSNRGELKALALPRFKEVDHVRLSFGKSNDFAMLSTSSYKSPRTIYSLEIPQMRLQQWNIPFVPEIDISKNSPAKLEYYTARDNTPIPMFVRRSTFCEKNICPVVVHFHGGPEGQSLPGFSPFAQLFVENNFIFVEPNVRGSTGYGKKWLEADNGPLREKVITDIEDCSIWIKKNWSQKGKIPKIGIFGGSYGGYSTLMGMTYFAGAYDAGVANVGMSNLVTFLENTAPYRRILREKEYGYLNTDLESLKRLSPINYISKVQGPLLIIQGANDPRVPAGEAIQMFEAMEKKGLPTQLIIFADEGHGTIKKENKMMEWGHTFGFFNKHLK